MKKNYIIVLMLFYLTNIAFGYECKFDSNWNCEYYEKICIDVPVVSKTGPVKSCQDIKIPVNLTEEERLRDEIQHLRNAINKSSSFIGGNSVQQRSIYAQKSNMTYIMELKKKRLNELLENKNTKSSNNTVQNSDNNYDNPSYFDGYNPGKHSGGNNKPITGTGIDAYNPGMFNNSYDLTPDEISASQNELNYEDKKSLMDNCSGPGICKNILHGQNNYIKDGEYENAYNRAYEYNITTMNSLSGANIYGNITRSEFAKMISNFAINVLGISKDENKNCYFVDGNIGGDLQDAIINSCQLGLMGQGTKQFNPNGFITKGEVATILDRLIYPNDVKQCNPFYKCSYDKLNNQTLLTSEGTELSNEKRGNIFIMLNRACRATSFPVPYKNKMNVCDWWIMDGNEYKFYLKNHSGNLNNVSVSDETNSGNIESGNNSNENVDNDSEICSDPSVKLACSMHAASCPSECN